MKRVDSIGMGMWCVWGALLWVSACGGGTDPDAGTEDARVAECASSVDCDDGRYCDGRERCVSSECVPGSPILCADGVDCTADRCDEARQACVHQAPDDDGDGHASVGCGGDDCDNEDADRYPGQVELCDALDHDEDCDPFTFGFRDADSDGWPDATCCNVDQDGTRHCGDDCDDTLPVAHPAEAESCDGVDNDCDGTIDQGVTQTFTRDDDGDGHGSVDGETREACYAPEGFAPGADDCDDLEPRAHPGTVEVCDHELPGIDEDCDGVANPPALCDCTAGTSGGCALAGVCAAGTRDCVGGSWSACSIAGRTETCNGLDDDCDGLTDEGLQVTCFLDADGDSVAAAGTPSEARCPAPGRDFVGGCPRGTTNRAPLGASNLDCDDSDATRRPGAAEACDAIDNDCDGAVDEGVTLTCFTDADSDGFGVGAGAPVCPGAGTNVCPAGMTGNAPSVVGFDCADGDPLRSPGVAETCDGLDDDCDGIVDDGVTIECYPDADGDGYATSSAPSTARCPASPSAPCPAGETARMPAGPATTDCDDASSAASPAVIEICDGADNDCDAMIDEGLEVPRHRDLDGDGFGAGPAVPVCPLEPRYADSDTDCNDDNPAVFPGSLVGHVDPICPAGSTACTVTQGAPAFSARLGCQVGAWCRDLLEYWDYDCNGLVELSTPAAGTCVYDPPGPTAPRCLGDYDCTGTAGMVWNSSISGLPCGLGPPDAYFAACTCGEEGDHGCNLKSSASGAGDSRGGRVACH